MKCSDYIAHFLNRKKIDTLFGYLGGYNADIIDSFCGIPGNRFVLDYHEQAAAFAVNAIAAVTGKAAVVTTSGAPSTCNTVAGIANAYFDSHPCVFIVGSAHSLAIRKTPEMRQKGFEEIDFVNMVSGIAKYAVRLQSPERIRFELEKAFYIAEEGRKGPAVLDIPYDMARAEIDPDRLPPFPLPDPERFDDADCRRIIDLLTHSKRPVLMLGGGAGSAVCRKQVRAFLEKVKLPAVATMCGLDVLGHEHPCFAGFIGHYGNRYANLAVANCDLLLVLGARLEERQMGGYLTKLESGAKLIRVDIDRTELNTRLHEDISIRSSAEAFLESLLKQLPALDFARWRECVVKWRERYPSVPPAGELNANHVVRALTEMLPEDGVVTADVGQNQMSVAQAAFLDGDKRLLNSAGYASMGYSLPAAIGASFARPGARVLSFNGDGGIQMNIQELQTLAREHLPITVVVFNNGCLGMIRKLQEKLYRNRTFVSVSGYSAPNFGAVAAAYKIPYLKICSADQLKELGAAVRCDGPFFIEAVLPLETDNIPEPGAVIDGQSPVLSGEEMELIKEECGSL